MPAHLQPVEANFPNGPAVGGRLVTFAPGLTLPCAMLTYDANEEIFAEEEPTDFVYKVISGTVRTTRLISDGRRQIGAFYMAGDVFGLGSGALRRFSAEAVRPSKIAFARRSKLESMADLDGRAARALYALAAQELDAVQDHMLLLGRKSAAERVGGFLLTLAQDAPGGVVELPMSRCDIADHLGLTLETVSRAFSRLARERVITLPNARRVVVRDYAALLAA